MAEQVCCLECGTPFETRRSLHAHIKVHSMTVGEYYVNNLPKFDLCTGEPIPYKNYDLYISSDFRNKKNMYTWLDTIDNKDGYVYCEKTFEKHMKGRDYIFAPNHLYFLTHPRMPKISYFNRAGFDRVVKYFGMVNVFDKKIDKCPDFKDVPEDLVIFEDTREQQPLKFAVESKREKLDFGDYTASGKYYDYIYVDRKSENDFKGTVSSGFDRFCRELERARELESYIYIVVESDFLQIYANNRSLPAKRRTNLVFTWQQMRRIIVSYSDVCQFIFTGSRENSELITPYLLVNGQALKNVDIQYTMEKLGCLK